MCKKIPLVDDDLRRLRTTHERIGMDLKALHDHKTWDLEERREALKGIEETAKEILELVEEVEVTK